MPLPKKLQPLQDAVNVLQEEIEVLPPLNADEQVTLNNLLTAREKLSYAFLFTPAWGEMEHNSVSKEIEMALIHIQNAIGMLGRK